MAPENGRIDFRAAKLEMQPGQRYRVIGDKSAIIVEVDPKASAAETGVRERVVLLESKSVSSN